MLDKIRAYIDGGQAVKSKNALRYSMGFDEIVALMQKATETPADAVLLAFRYGLEKGYRMEKAEVKRNADA